MRTRMRHVATLTMALLGMELGAAEPEVVPCDGVSASVQTLYPKSAGLACAGARDAVKFLEKLVIPFTSPVLIELVARLPADLRKDAVGCYALKSRRLMVLEFPDFMARNTWFGVPVGSSLYRSVVAHEVAHALVGCHLEQRTLPSAGHEYVAYVTMFATMSPQVREAALRATPGEGFRFDAEINNLRYALDPMVFGADAYRHWLRQPAPMDFLRQVIRGQIVPNLLL